MTQPAQGASARADFVTALVWIALGLAIVAGALAMDRLERFGAKVYTAPGLVPGILGALIAFLGGVLLLRSVRRGAVASFAERWLPTRRDARTLARTTLAIALSLVYTLVLVGHGLPFWLVTAVFVFVFMLLFDLPERRARGETARGVVLIAAIVAWPRRRSSR